MDPEELQKSLVPSPVMVTPLSAVLCTLNLPTCRQKLTLPVCGLSGQDVVPLVIASSAQRLLL